MPSSTGSGPKFAAIISQPMLSARSVGRLPRSACSSACCQASSARASEPEDRPLDAAAQVPRLGERERIAELLGGAQHFLDVVVEPVAVAAEDA